jgi:hypothetical protein
MPRWFAEARDNIAKVKAVIGGDWVGRDAPLNPSVELRVGTFGDTAPSFLLVERTSLESYGQFHKLSVLFYSADCHAYEMLSVDKLSEPGAANAGDCRRSFPIESHPDGSLSFQYSDWNNERVQVVVDKVHWRETRDTAGSQRSEILSSSGAPRRQTGAAFNNSVQLCSTCPKWVANGRPGYPE